MTATPATTTVTARTDDLNEPAILGLHMDVDLGSLDRRTNHIIQHPGAVSCESSDGRQ